MHNLADYEERFRHHEEKTAAVDREGWMRPQRGRRSVRAALTKALLALATRIAPADEMSAPATTLADMRGA